MVEQVTYYWRLVKSYMRMGEYNKAINNAYDLIMECVFLLLMSIVRLPFLLPAVLIMLVAKFRSSKS